MPLEHNGNFNDITIIIFCVRFGERRKKMTSIYACYYIAFERRRKKYHKEKVTDYRLRVHRKNKNEEKKHCHKTTKESYTITTYTQVENCLFFRSLSLCWQRASPLPFLPAFSPATLFQLKSKAIKMTHCYFWQLCNETHVLHTACGVRKAVKKIYSQCECENNTANMCAQCYLTYIAKETLTKNAKKTSQAAHCKNMKYEK